MFGVLQPARSDGEKGPLPSLRVQLFVGLFVALNVMALSLAFYGPGVFGEAAVPQGIWGTVSELFEYLILFLTTIVMATLGMPMFADALRDGAGRFGWINARSLVSVGVIAAFALSVWHTLSGAGQIYYDTITMVLVVITAGKHLEARAKRSAVNDLATALDGLPHTVEIERAGARFESDVDALEIGDRVRVRPGQAIPVDGTIVAGSSFIDASGITGEPHAISRGEGDAVFAGSISIDGLLWVLAERVDSERLLARIDRLLHEALASRSPAVRTADRVARILAPLIVGVALLVFALFAQRGMAAEGILRGLSVLLIACPCALAIAPGLIMASAMRRSAQHGIVFGSTTGVERVAQIDVLFMDKTGTLTGSTSVVEDVLVADTATREEVLQLLASIEAHGDHPIALGLTQFAATQGVRPHPIESLHVLPGLGVEACVAGQRYLVGGSRMRKKYSNDEFATQGDDVGVYLLHAGRVLATVALSDPPRHDAHEALARLRQLGVQVSGLSGDGAARAEALGVQLGIPIEGDLLPRDKVERVSAAVDRSDGAAVAMVGDGINDAAALARADVGIAVATATDLSRRAGEVLLLRDRLTLIPTAIEIARDARRRLRLSLIWAIGYNAVGVGLAVSGNLQPAFAATAMAASSLLVIGYARNAGVHESLDIAGSPPPTPGK